MLVFPDGQFIRDIDIDELRISFGKGLCKKIVLTKDKIAYQNTINPSIGYMDFPQGYFDIKEISISLEQFKQLSDDIHEAGLYNLIQPVSEYDLCSGVDYQILTCIFDDGAQYEYVTKEKPKKEFEDIVQILLSFILPRISRI